MNKWQDVYLRDICTLINGRAYSKNELLDKGKYPVLRVGNFFTNRSWYYSDLELPEDKYCDDGDLLYAWSASFGPRIWQGGKVIYHYHIWKVMIDESKVDKDFLFYWFDWDVEEIKSAQGAGTTMIHVTKGAMENRSLKIPPLPEQTRIVAILDEAFANISQAVVNAEKNLANARELFDSYLNEVFTRKGEGWIRTTIGEQLTLQRGFDITKNQQEDGDIPVVSSGGIKSHHNIGKVLPPGVVIGRKGSLGTVYYLETQYWPHDTTLWVKDFKGNNQKLIYYFFRSLDVKKLDTGTANPALNRNLIHPIKVNWPLYSIQQDLVRTLDDAQNNCQELEDVYRRKLAALAELKQALLQKAFTGELTANHPHPQ